MPPSVVFRLVRGEIMEIDWKALYREKEELLQQYLEEVSPYEFYRELWPVGSFEKLGCQDEKKPNGLALQIQGKGKARHFVLTDGLEQLDELLQGEFVITAPISYYGKRRTGSNARYCYALAFDLDGVQMPQLRDVLHQIKNDILPKPTFLVNSGRGLHLYYFLDWTPALMPHIQACLKELKYALTRQIWNRYTSTRKDIEVQGILQGFRMVGSPTKLGREYPVTAYRIGDRVKLDYLVSFVPETSGERKRIYDALKSKVTLQEAKEKYPEWYQRRIVEGQPRGRWTVKRDLYDWWLNRIRDEIKVGHRFFGCMTLAIYAVKCGISEEELREDAYSLLDGYDAMSYESTNRFTEDDIEAAIGIYNDSYCTFPRDDIAKVTGLKMPVNKWNGRSQHEHLRRARAVQSVDYPDGEWRNKYGRPDEQLSVQMFRKLYPEGTKKECKDRTGLSYPTIRKWWDKPAEQPSAEEISEMLTTYTRPEGSKIDFFEN